MRAEQKKANDRLIKVMNHCIARKQCKNKLDFAQKLKVTPATITHIATYRQNIPYAMLFELRKVFEISANYILFNEGQEFLSQNKKDTLEDLSRRVAELENKIHK